MVLCRLLNERFLLMAGNRTSLGINQQESIVDAQNRPFPQKNTRDPKAQPRDFRGTMYVRNISSLTKNIRHSLSTTLTPTQRGVSCAK